MLETNGIVDIFVVAAAGTSGLYGLILLWITFMGACIGSFMNVVIYRVPANLNVAYPGSRCPRCMHPIRGFDNIPVLSWILLGAKCRDCHLPIPARYPLVEALVASVFVVLAVREPMTFGMNLPSPVTLDPLSLLPEGILWGMYAMHMLLLCTFICSAFMYFDGHVPPLRLYVLLLVATAVLPVMYPALRPQTLLQDMGWMTGTSAAIAESVIGLIIAPIVASIVSSMAVRLGMLAGCSATAMEIAAAVFLTGLPLSVACALAATMLFLVAGVVGRRWRSVRRIPWVAYFAATLLVHLIAWRPISESFRSLISRMM